MPAAVWAGFQWRRPKLRTSMRPPREFGNRIRFADGGRRSSPSSPIACSGTARVVSRVLVCLSRPFAYARRTYTTPAPRSTSRCSSANSSESRSPVAAANRTIGLYAGPSRSATASTCCHDSNGRFSFDRLIGFGTPRLAGLYSISPQATARFSTWRKRLSRLEPVPSGTVSRHAYTSFGESSPSRNSPTSRFPSSQRSFAIVIGSA